MGGTSKKLHYHYDMHTYPRSGLASPAPVQPYQALCCSWNMLGPTSGPLYVLFPLLSRLFPQISSIWILPSPPSDLFKCHLVRQASFSDPNYNSTFPIFYLLSWLYFYFIFDSSYLMLWMHLFAASPTREFYCFCSELCVWSLEPSRCSLNIYQGSMEVANTPPHVLCSPGPLE